MNTVCRFVVLPVLAACLVVPHAVAQLSTATINGVVRDATGSVIPDAELVLISAGTTVERRTQTNSVGVYSFFNLQPGSYTMRASKTGCATSTVQEFPLVVNWT